MLRARRQTPKAQACQLFANSSLMHGDAEALFDLAFQINAPPAHNPIGFGVGTRPNHFRQLLLLCRAQQTGWIRRAAVEQARHALRIVTVGPIPQRLPILPQFSAAVLRSTPSRTRAIANIRRAAFPSRHRAASWRSSPADLSLRVILTAIKASLALMPLNQITPLVGIPLSQIWGPLVSFPEDGSSSAPSHGSTAAGDWPKIGKNPSQVHRHGYSLHISEPSRVKLQGIVIMRRVLNQTLSITYANAAWLQALRATM